MGPTYELKTSDPSAWLELHGDALYAYALSRVRRPDVAEDLVQEALLAALGCADTFRGRSQERTWLIGILRHKVLDHFRKRKRSREVQEPAMGEGRGTMGLFNRRGRWHPKPNAWSGDPAAVYEDAEFWRVYEACRARLPSTLAEAYILRELEGLSPEQVCGVLDITPSNLGVRLHRARLAMRGCLDERWFQR
ncbi:MAG: sigma-70 family RNA polymerase sigma factor [Phycisphaeraceae bacterium]